MDESSTFATIRQLITVATIQTTVAEVSIDERLEYLVEVVDSELCSGEPLPVLVVDGGRIAGWLDPAWVHSWAETEGFECEDAVILRDVESDLVFRIDARDVISANTPLIDAAVLFSEGRLPKLKLSLIEWNPPDQMETCGFFFVLEQARIRGILRWGDLFKGIGRLCFFALTMELEEAALALCSKFAAESWDALPQSRAAQARSVHTKRYGGMTKNYIDRLEERTWLDGHNDLVQLLMRDLLDCTTFIDKATMITKCNLLVDFSNQKVRRLFSRAERIRNACAHPAISGQPEEIVTPKKLAELVRECQLLIDEIRTVTPR